MSDQQEAERFIGRRQELEIYEHWLNASTPSQPWILSFYDQAEKKGGIGKTWLLRECINLTRKTRPDVAIVMIDFFNVQDRGGVTIATRVAEQLQLAHPDWIPATFLATLQEFQQLLDKGGSDLASLRSQLFNAFYADLQRLDANLDQNKRALVLFFDTFELVELDPVIAVLAAGNTFPDTYHFKQIGAVIAGRNPLDWNLQNWQGREQEVLKVPLNPFSPAEMVQYMASRSFLMADIDEHNIAAFYDRTQGRPILVGLTVDVLNYQLMKQEELLHVSQTNFEATLVAQVNNLRNPTNWIILFMAHAYHRFNFALLDWMLKEASLQTLVPNVKRQNLEENLLMLSFVRHSSTGNDFVLHDEMRRLIIQYCWNVLDPDQSNRREVSRCAIRYYQQELERMSDKNDPLAQTYIVEMLYHHLYIDAEDGLRFFQQYFDEARVSWQRVYARSLLQEARNMADSLSFDQYCELDLAEASLLRREENAQAALDLYRKLEKQAQPHWFAKNQIDIFYGIGDAYLDQSNFNQALHYFAKCIELDKDQVNQERTAAILGLLGYISRRQGDLEKAVDYYNQSIIINRDIGNTRDYADMLNSMGHVLRLLGKVEEAQRYCKIALRLREKLFQQGKGGEVPIGLTISTLGIICLNTGDISQAEFYFQRAFKIFERNNYRTGIASLYNRFGHLNLARNEIKEAMRWFQQAEQASTEINTEAYVNSLNKQGRVLTRQEQWAEAIEFFERAIAKAREVNDYYQEAESLIDMAEPLERGGQHTASQESFRKGDEIAQKYHYYYLLGRSKQLEGNLQFQAKQYQEAFYFLGEACHIMGLYNQVRFNSALSSLEDRLMETPEQEIVTAIDILQRSFWPEENLAQEYHRFQEALEKVKSLLVL